MLEPCKDVKREQLSFMRKSGGTEVRCAVGGTKELEGEVGLQLSPPCV